MPKGTRGGPGPILEERFSLRVGVPRSPRGRSREPASSPVLGGLGCAADRLARRPRPPVRGADPRPRARAGAGHRGGQACRSSAGRPAAVEFAPPEDVRPGQVGTLIDEVAHTLDVTATIVDFAVRGHLHIRELRGRLPGLGAHPSSRTETPGSRATSHPLRRASSRAATVSGCRRSSRRLPQSSRACRRSSTPTWSPRAGSAAAPAPPRARPPGRRHRSRLVAAVGVTVVLALFTHAALLGVGLVVGGPRRARRGRQGARTHGQGQRDARQGSRLRALPEDRRGGADPVRGARRRSSPATCRTRWCSGSPSSAAERFAALGVESVSWYSGPLSSGSCTSRARSARSPPRRRG